MIVLLDTNILCRLAERGHPHHESASAAVIKLRSAGHGLCLIPQVVYEFWVVATRPVENNGLGMAAAKVSSSIDELIAQINVLRDDVATFDSWRMLVQKYGVKGKAAHDTRLVAAMLLHGVKCLLTFNASDFARYSEINVYTPEDIVHDKFSIG
jgi:predicted nucleic acid-binding protein